MIEQLEAAVRDARLWAPTVAGTDIDEAYYVAHIMPEVYKSDAQ